MAVLLTGSTPSVLYVGCQERHCVPGLVVGTVYTWLYCKVDRLKICDGVDGAGCISDNKTNLRQPL